MRAVGVSGAGIAGGLGAADQELTDTDAIIGTEATPPDTATDTGLGGGATPGAAPGGAGTI